MLLPDNIIPELSIYYNGAIVLKLLRNSDSLFFLDLYNKLKNEEHMSLSTYVLCLDRLFLIDVARVNESGRVELCI